MKKILSFFLSLFITVSLCIMPTTTNVKAAATGTQYVKNSTSKFINAASLNSYRNYVGKELTSSEIKLILNRSAITPNTTDPGGGSGGVGYGCAWYYTQVNSVDINCYGYASRFNSKLDPGNIAGYRLPYRSEVYTVAAYVMRDLTAAGRHGRMIYSATDSIYPNEYRIAIRVGVHNGGESWDYHFMLQCAGGGWCDKHSIYPSEYLGDINPSNYSWDMGTNIGFYNSATVYLAITK